MRDLPDISHETMAETPTILERLHLDQSNVRRHGRANRRATILDLAGHIARMSPGIIATSPHPL